MATYGSFGRLPSADALFTNRSNTYKQNNERSHRSLFNDSVVSLFPHRRYTDNVSGCTFGDAALRKLSKKLLVG